MEFHLYRKLIRKVCIKCIRKISQKSEGLVYIYKYIYIYIYIYNIYIYIHIYIYIYIYIKRVFQGLSEGLSRIIFFSCGYLAMLKSNLEKIPKHQPRPHGKVLSQLGEIPTKIK